MTNISDRLGIWVSGLCALHCLSLPILLSLIPMMGATFFAQHWFEELILILSFAIGFWAILVSFFRHHRQFYPLYSLSLGGLMFWHKDMLGHNWEPVAVSMGALLIITAHIINLKQCKRCQDCEGYHS